MDCSRCSKRDDYAPRIVRIREQANVRALFSQTAWLVHKGEMMLRDRFDHIPNDNLADDSNAKKFLRTVKRRVERHNQCLFKRKRRCKRWASSSKWCELLERGSAGHVYLRQLLSGMHPDCMCLKQCLTPLMFAAKTGDLVLAKLCLMAGANIEATDEAGNTARSHALKERHSHLNDFLAMSGAHPNCIGVGTSNDMYM